MKTDDKHQLKVQKFFEQENIQVGCQLLTCQQYVCFIMKKFEHVWGGGSMYSEDQVWKHVLGTPVLSGARARLCTGGLRPGPCTERPSTLRSEGSHEQTENTTENITFPQTMYACGNKKAFQSKANYPL